ncbi:MAG: DUF72 domain-containing protein [Candidatus Lokiarchaeota archaeon]|nr:DUF72 domain-containing protein [Candidatus Lokiarchaeota archaeon]MBD3201350.1 DUF72 domain-containing protein [Candidatus Lokiarchaeota archaeon]
MKKKVLIGCSGWSYDEWVGPFYPKGLDSKDFLHYYSEIYYTNEINTTFYNIPAKWIVKSWVKRTPEDFLFSAKIPRVITHENKLDLRNCQEDLAIYLDSMSPLIENNKLIAFLIQLPPSFNREEHFDNLKDFIENWPDDYKSKFYHLVVEFRHKSWMRSQVFDYLRKKSLTYCGVIEPLLPPRMDVTNNEFAYLRFHGFGKKPWFNYFFTEQEIKEYAQNIKKVIDQANIVGIYFNNHFSGYAPKNASMLMKELKIKPRKNPDQVDILDVKKKSGTLSKDQTSLDRFIK